MSVGAPDTPFPQRREFSIASPSMHSTAALHGDPHGDDEAEGEDGDDVQTFGDAGHVDVEGPAVDASLREGEEEDVDLDLSDRSDDGASDGLPVSHAPSLTTRYGCEV